MADDINNQESLGAAPPKQSPFSTVTPGGSAAAPKTIVLRKPTLRRPGEAPSVPVSPLSPAGLPGAKPLSQTSQVAQGIAISHTEAAKKMTSRISVSSATSPIPPVVPVPAEVPAAKPLSASPISPIAPVAPAEAAKKLTSRITLESAFSAQPEVPVSNQPKTIRLKRPSEVASPAAPPSVSIAAPAPAPEAAPAAAPEGDESLTRRKTIKVKRPGATGGAPKISLNRPEGEGATGTGDNLQSLTGFAAQPRSSEGPDKVNPIFIVAAVIAIIAGSILVWALSAQTFGERGAAGDFAFPKGPMIPPPPGAVVID